MTPVSGSTIQVYTPYHRTNVLDSDSNGQQAGHTENQQQDSKMLVAEQKMLCSRLPKPSTIKNFINKMETKFEQWIERRNSRPHDYDIDGIEDKVNTVLDIIDNGTTTVATDNNNNSQLISVNV